MRKICKICDHICFLWDVGCNLHIFNGQVVKTHPKGTVSLLEGALARSSINLELNIACPSYGSQFCNLAPVCAFPVCLCVC